MHLTLLPVFFAVTVCHVIRHEVDSSSKSGDSDSPYLFNDDYFSFDAKPTQLEKRTAKGDCEKIVKDESVICMVCKDSKTNGKYEQCSYTHRPKDKVYKFSRSKSFGGAEDSPSAKVSARNSEKADDKSADSSEVKSEKEHGSETRVEIDRRKASPPDCHEVVKDSMTCTVCNDPKVNGNYEKCTYSHRPKDKVYQFSRSKSFGSDPHSDASAEDANAKTSGSSGDDATERHSESASYSPDAERSSPYTDGSGSHSEGSNPYRYSFGSSSSFSPTQIHKEIASRSEDIEKDRGYDPDIFSGHFSFDDRFKSQDRQAKGETENKAIVSSKDKGEVTIPIVEYDFGDESKHEPAEFNVEDEASMKGYDDSKRKEFEKLLQDFKAKDRSKCQRVMKDKMACYKCTDEKGVHKEECMFVGESDTRSQPVEDAAYTGFKEFQYEPTGSKRKPRHDTEIPLEPIAAASAHQRIVTSSRDEDGEYLYPAVASTGKLYEKRKKAAGDWDSRKKIRSEKKLEPRTTPSDDQPLATEEEKVEVQNDEGIKEVEPYEFVMETRPIYDEILGISLPAYMLSKSEDEIEFDRLVEASKS